MHSYKGGSGKTTCAIQIAKKAAKENNVLLIESDFMMPAFHKIFAEFPPNGYFNEYMDKPSTTKLKKVVTKISPEFYVIFADPAFGTGDEITKQDKSWYIPRLRALQRDLPQICKEFNIDRVILDTPPGWHFGVVVNLMLSDTVVSILRPDQPSIAGTQKLVEEIYSKAKPRKYLKIYLLLNQVPQKGLEIEIEKWSELLRSIEGVEWLGIIPSSDEISIMVAQGGLDLQTVSPELDNTLNLLSSKVW